MARPSTPIDLSPEQEADLRALARAPSTPQQLGLRVRIVLRAAAGESNKDIAAALRTTTQTVSLWRGRFARQGPAGLRDAPRSGRPRTVDDDMVQRVLAKTLKPPPATVQRIWAQRRVKPLHRRGLLPEVRPVATVRARIRIAQGELSPAWAGSRPWSVDHR